MRNLGGKEEGWWVAGVVDWSGGLERKDGGGGVEKG